MGEWILSAFGYFFSNWWDLIVGGTVVVSIVIFIMGLLKSLLINKVKNTLLRKVILAWLSIVVVLPVTVISVIYNGFNRDYFWFIYAVNCVGTIVIYWFYENTALRNSLAFIGKKIVIKITADKSEKSLNKALEEASKEAESLLKSETKITQSKPESKYKDEDLNNL